MKAENSCGIFILSGNNLNRVEDALKQVCGKEQVNCTRTFTCELAAVLLPSEVKKLKQKQIEVTPFDQTTDQTGLIYEALKVAGTKGRRRPPLPHDLGG